MWSGALAIRCIASLHPTRIAIARGGRMNLHRTCAFTSERGWWATAIPFPLGQLPRIPLGAGTWAGVLACMHGRVLTSSAHISIDVGMSTEFVAQGGLEHAPEAEEAETTPGGRRGGD